MKRLDVTKNLYRARIRDPKVCASNSFRIKTLSAEKGIRATVCCPVGKFRAGKCKVGTIVQSVLYDKKKFSRKQAEKHAKKTFG
jgi:hypothetical protein